MTTKTVPARLSMLCFLCILLAVGLGIDRVSGAIHARAEANSLFATIVGMAIGDDGLCAQAGKAVEIRGCLRRTQRDGMSTDGHRWSARNVVHQRLSLSVSICEGRSRTCVHLL